jgi:hypothetical protein
MKVLIVKGVEFQLDDEVYERVKGYRWYIVCKKYARRQVRTRLGLMWMQLHWEPIGMPPIGLTVDHVDRNPLNNQRANLRFATKQQQSWNAKSRVRSNTSCRLKGAFVCKSSSLNPWKSWIMKNGKRFYLGVFPTAQAASDAYYKAAKRLFGEFAAR